MHVVNSIGTRGTRNRSHTLRGVVTIPLHSLHYSLILCILRPPTPSLVPIFYKVSVFFYLLEFCVSENLRQSASLSEQEICYMRDLEMFLTLQALL